VEAQIDTGQSSDRPHMALGCAVMDTLGGATEENAGHEIRRAREALGLSQAELGRRAGVGQRTVKRVEAGQGSHEGRTIGALRRVLGLPVAGSPPSPTEVLRAVDTSDLIAEVTRRLLIADDTIRAGRVQVGHLPPDVTDKPGIIRGPETNEQRFGSDD